MASNGEQLSGAGRRRKGVKGEREITVKFEEHGFDVRGLEGAGDHIATKGKPGGLLALHIETKRQERMRPRLWMNQCVSETPSGMVPLVVARESNEEWLAMLPLSDLLDLLDRVNGHE